MSGTNHTTGGYPCEYISHGTITLTFPPVPPGTTGLQTVTIRGLRTYERGTDPEFEPVNRSGDARSPLTADPDPYGPNERLTVANIGAYLARLAFNRHMAKVEERHFGNKPGTEPAFCDRCWHGPCICTDLLPERCCE